MSIIIRLQNLPWEANSLDIRRFFQGLSIPDGGVHIVGGENGDAFIAFASDEDARQAMGRAGGQIKESRVKLMLSSRNEMQQVIEQARTQTLGLKTGDTNVTNNSTVTLAPPQQQQPPQQIQSNVNVPVIPPPVNINTLADLDPRHTDNIMSRNNDRNFKNRDRSRSPHFPNNRQQYGHGNRMNDNRIRGDSRFSNNNSNDEMPNHFNGNGNTNIRNRLGGYVDSQIPPFDTSHPPPPINQNNDRRFFNDKLNDDRFSNQAINQKPQTPLNEQFQSSQVRNYAIEMRGLPYQVIPKDIRDFFRLIELFVPEENIKILVNANGYTTGGAKVRFPNDREFELALSLNGRFMGDRRIDVMPLIENIDTQALPPPALPVQPLPVQTRQTNINSNNIRSLPDQIPKHDYVVYMKGIPYNSCTQRDITGFFGNLQIQDIVIETDQTGKPAGNAFVEFPTRDDYNSALEMNRKHMGRRYIEIFPTNKEDMNEARRMSFAVQRGGPAPVVNLQPVDNDVRMTYCINITGLPPTVTNRDLTNYFLEVNAQPYAIHIMLNSNGYNAGEAFLEFSELDHHNRALRRDNESIGNYRIKIKPVSYEMMRSIVNPIQGPQNTGFTSNNNNTNNNSVVSPTQNVTGIQSNSFTPHRGENNGPMSQNRVRGHRGPSRFDDRRNNDRNNRNDRRGDVQSRDPFSDQRCVILATNIPYRASIEDICVFFADFNITPDNVLRRFNEKGQPTADAKIAFRSPEEANRAVRMMHKKFLIERPVFLRHAF